MRNCVRVAQQTLTLYVWVRILVPQPLAPNTFRGCFIEVWRSLVARFVRDEEVAGSNPVTSTTTQALKSVDSISLLRAFSFINHPKMTVSSLFSSLFMKISVVYLAADSSSRS